MEGAVGRPLGLDMDPLVVAGDIGETINPGLSNSQPGAWAQGLPDGSAEFLDAR
jgi:hypothetical protein